MGPSFGVGDEPTIRIEPVVSIVDGTVVEYEASTQYHAAQRLLAPNDARPDDPHSFSSAAHDELLVFAADILERAAGDARREVRLCVPMSAAAVAHPRFADEFVQRLDHVGLRPTSVQLEIPDEHHTHVGNAPWAMSELRAAGVRLALAEFGRSSSRSRTACGFDFDAVKLASRVLSTDTNLACGERLGSIMRLAGQSGLMVVAKGVETPDQHERLIGSGCRFAQGPLYGHARPYRPASGEGLPAAAAWDGLPAANLRIAKVRSMIAHGALRSLEVAAALREVHFGTRADVVLFAANQYPSGDVAVQPDSADTALTTRLARRAHAICEALSAEGGPVQASVEADLCPGLFTMPVVCRSGIVLGVLFVVAPAVAAPALSPVMSGACARLAAHLDRFRPPVQGRWH
jgi:EAL domain-containing protein (putative c-di-GMP-specific phosphodiesterase class I)